MNKCLTPLLVMLCVILSGCAGGMCHVTAHSVPQPVSCTPCVFDASGHIVRATPQEVVRHVSLSRNNWTLFWMSVHLNNQNWDISTNLNELLEATPGNAVVNVTVAGTPCDFIHGFFAALIPVIPSYNRVKVEGDIVQIPQGKP